MAHFAKISESNIVEEVLVVPNEHEEDGESYLHSLGLEGRWVQASYNWNFRGRFAAIGWPYDEENDVFTGPAAK